MLKRILLYFALLWFVVPIMAQPTIIASNISTGPGETVDVEFRVFNIVDLTTMQFSIHWDKTVLEFVELGNFNLNNLTNETFGDFEADAAEGFLRFLWVDGSSTVEGQTVDDDTRIMTITFKAIGELNSTSGITFTGSPIAIEFSVNSLAVPGETQDGAVVLDMPSSTEFPINENNNKLYQNYPNPFDNYTVIRFDLAHSQDVTLKIFDINGTLISTNTGNYGQGTHDLELEQSDFPTAGVYLYQLVTNDDLLTKKMFVIK